MIISDKTMLFDAMEARLLDYFEDYNPQGYYNNKFVNYLYKYIRDNTYSGEHNDLLSDFNKLISYNELFKNTKVKEFTDRQTYQFTDDTGITNEMLTLIIQILSKYYNYKFTLISENRVEVVVRFGWLPNNTTSWLNIIDGDSQIVDYYIDGVTLRPNKYTRNPAIPDSGYVCYLIENVKAYDTIMFLFDKAKLKDKSVNIKVATLLTELRGSKGATLNRIAESNTKENFFYELGPYNQNYLTATYSALVIQIPWSYAVDEYYRLYDVTYNVKINPNNNPDPNNKDNFFVLFNDPDFDYMFSKLAIKNLNYIIDIMINKTDILDDVFVQYFFGDFIWKTSDSKLIAYIQNLINTLYKNAHIIVNGVWSDELAQFITRFKQSSSSSIYNDDVVDKITEEAMLHTYSSYYKNLDPNEELFTEW